VSALVHLEPTITLLKESASQQPALAPLFLTLHLLNVSQDAPQASITALQMVVIITVTQNVLSAMDRVPTNV